MLPCILTCNLLWNVSAVWQRDPIFSGTCPLLLTLNHTYSFTLFPGSQVRITTLTLITKREIALTDKEACCSLTVIRSKAPWKRAKSNFFLKWNRIVTSNQLTKEVKALSSVSFPLHLSKFHQCHIQEDIFHTSNCTPLPCQELLLAHTTGVRLGTAIGQAIIRISFSPRNGGTVVKWLYTFIYSCTVHWNHSKFAGACLECVQTSENTKKVLWRKLNYFENPCQARMCLCVCAFSAKCNELLAIHIPSNNCKLIKHHFAMGDWQLWCGFIFKQIIFLCIPLYTPVFMVTDSTFKKKGLHVPTNVVNALSSVPKVVMQSTRVAWIVLAQVRFPSGAGE